MNERKEERLYYIFWGNRPIPEVNGIKPELNINKVLWPGMAELSLICDVSGLACMYYGRTHSHQWLARINL